MSNEVREIAIKQRVYKQLTPADKSMSNDRWTARHDYRAGKYVFDRAHIKRNFFYVTSTTLSPESDNLDAGEFSTNGFPRKTN